MSFALGILCRSTIVLLFAALLVAILNRASASVRHAVWAVGLLGALAVPLVSIGLPALDLPVLSPSVESVAVPLLTATSGVIDVASPGVASETVTGQDSATGTREPSRYGISLVESMGLIWLSGFVLVMRRLWNGWRSAKRLADGHAVLDASWNPMLDALRSEFAIANPVRLAMAGTFAPMTWGLMRNVILLPAAANQWPEDRRRVVLAHELAHVKRRDGVMQVIVQVACGVYWFNPLVWYAALRLRAERELACDDYVLNIGTNAHDYASHLLQVARATSRSGSLAQATISMAHPSQLESRLRAILDPGKRRTKLSAFAAVVLFGSVGTLTLFAATVHMTALPLPPAPLAISVEITLPQTPPVIPAAPPPQPTHPDAHERQLLFSKLIGVPLVEQAKVEKPVYQKWLDEDVVYLITDDEKKAFTALGTDEERDRFVEQFWKRRDPTPDTLPNEFKEEHYRRIAYVNERFKSTKPGWQTDRGRIYILHGPPDSIDDHPTGGVYTLPSFEGGGTTNTYPFQVWTYRYLDGIGNNVQLEFVDPSRQNEYRLTFDPKTKVILDRPPVKLPSSTGQVSRTAEPILSFEVASIRPGHGGAVGLCHGFDSKIGSGDPMVGVPLGRCVISGARVDHLVNQAYRVGTMQLIKIASSVPDWVSTARFDVEAKAENPSSTTEGQLYLMLQNLLADRFKLLIHREATEVSGFALVVAKGGLKIAEAKSDEEHKLVDILPPGVEPKAKKSAGSADPAGLHTLIGQNVSISELVRHLSLFGEVRFAVNETKLTGFYDFKLTWEMGESVLGPLEKELGLRLEPRKVPAEYFVIDSAEKPTLN